MIKKYVKRPYAIEAVQWGGNANYPLDEHNFLFDKGRLEIDGTNTILIVGTLEGDMKAYPGDYIVKGVDGEYYPVKKEIFEKTYREMKMPDPNAVCFKDGLNLEEKWVEQEKEFEKDEWVCVKKDRLESVISATFENLIPYHENCPLAESNFCPINHDENVSDCDSCKYCVTKIDDYIPIKETMRWLEGEGDD